MVVRRLPAVALLVLVLVACGGDDDRGDDTARTTLPPATTTPAGELGPPYIGSLAFDWPPDCRIPVREEVEKKSRVVELEYDIVLSPSGPDTELSMVDLRVLTMDGDAVPAAASAQVSAAFKLPRLVYDGDGIGVDIRGIDEVFEAIEALNPTGEPVEFPDALRQQLSEALLDKYWGTWAGTWASLGSIVEPTETIDHQVPIGDQLIDSTLTVTSVGVTPDGLAVLRAETTLGSEGMRAAMSSLMDTLQGSVTDEELATLDGERVTTIEVTTDPDTLRPTEARIDIESTFSIGADTQEDVERRAWVFDWDASTCA